MARRNLSIFLVTASVVAGSIAAVSLADEAADLTNDANIVAPQPAEATGWSVEQMEQAEVMRLSSDDDLKMSGEERPPAVDQAPTHSGASSDEKGVVALQSSGDRNAIPLRYSGRLFFKKPNGDKYNCSAQFISRRVILTAAHCVRDNKTGAWYRDVTFALQYERGNYSKKYAVDCILTKAGYVTTQEKTKRRFDYALLRTKEDSLTGHFGWASSWRGSYRQAVKIGYPGEIEGGKVVQIEAGPIFFPSEPAGTIAIRHGNPLSGRGSSGGAFIVNYSSSGGANSNIIISVTSSSYRKDPLVDLGPYFDEGFNSMFQQISTTGCR